MAEDVDTALASSEHGWQYFDGEEHVYLSMVWMALTVITGMGRTTTTTGFDSPTMITSPPISHSTLMTPILGPGIVWIVNGGSAGREHVVTSSISTLSEVSKVNIAPMQTRCPQKDAANSGDVRS